jgi:hypothetical protein
MHHSLLVQASKGDFNDFASKVLFLPKLESEWYHLTSERHFMHSLCLQGYVFIKYVQCE